MMMIYFQVMTESEIPGGPPRQVSVEAASPQELHVTWQPPEQQLWNGELLGYKIGFRKIGYRFQFNYSYIVTIGCSVFPSNTTHYSYHRAILSITNSS